MVKSIVDAAVLEEAQLVDESAEAGDRVSPSSAKKKLAIITSSCCANENRFCT